MKIGKVISLAIILLGLADSGIMLAADAPHASPNPNGIPNSVPPYGNDGKPLPPPDIVVPTLPSAGNGTNGSVGGMPAPPSLIDSKASELSLPGEGSAPIVPRLPSGGAPAVPQVPSGNTPAIPQLPSGNAPAAPQLPADNAPAVPQLPSVPSIPTLPSAGGPAVPQLPADNGPAVPQLPSGNTPPAIPPLPSGGGNNPTAPQLSPPIPTPPSTLPTVPPVTPPVGKPEDEASKQAVTPPTENQDKKNASSKKAKKKKKKKHKKKKELLIFSIKEQAPDAIHRKSYDRFNKHLPLVYYDRDYDNLVFLTAMHDDIDGLRSLLNQGRDVNMVNEEGDTPLLVAVRNNAINAAFLLIKRNAYPNVIDRNGLSPIQIASQMGNQDMVFVLSVAQ